jgi:opacity protein-like surface antigen
MTRKVFGRILVLTFVAASAQSAAAQSPVVPGYTDIGAVVGFGGIGSASLSLGGRFERAFTTMPSLNDGTIGIMVSVDYYSWSSAYPGLYNYSVKYIPIGATANYHFKLDNDKFDPFVGVGLGYYLVTSSCGGFTNCGGYSSSIYFIGRLGARYFLGSNMALYADVGAGAATLNAGLTFKLK